MFALKLKLSHRVAVGAVVAVLFCAPPARADHIDRVVVRDAREIATAVEKLEARNVAVLKFRVKIGPAEPSLLVGTAAGIEMQHRLENILLLTLDPKDPKFTLLKDDGTAAEKASREAKKGIDWTTPDGRKELFKCDLPVLWKESEKRTPDAFLTGDLEVSEDYQRARVKIVAFTKGAPEKAKDVWTLMEIADKDIWLLTDRSMLASLGRSFTTDRGLEKINLKKKEERKSEDLFAADRSAAGAVRRSLDGKAPPPSPVQLKVFFDGEPVDYKPSDVDPGEFALTRQGKSGQKMTFQLCNTSDKPLAVLLCVDGQNMIAIEHESLGNPDKPPGKFMMYVLEPKTKVPFYPIEGTYENRAGDTGILRVQPDNKTDELYKALRPDVRGKIHMFVYGPRIYKVVDITKTDGTEPIPLPGRVLEDILNDNHGGAALVAVGSELGKTGDVAAAQKLVAGLTELDYTPGKPSINRALAQSRPKGLVGKTPGPKGTPPVAMKFAYDEHPLDSLVITYYRK